MLSALSEKLELTFKKLRGLGRISESNIADAMREIRLALLEADVDFTVTKNLIEAVRTQAVGEEVLRTVSWAADRQNLPGRAGQYPWRWYHGPEFRRKPAHLDGRSQWCR